MITQEKEFLHEERKDRTILNKQLEDIGWALFLIMIGCLLIIPDQQVPEGTWLVGTGIIMIGLNGVRYLKNIKINILTFTLGFLALAAGIAQVFGLSLPLFAAFLIVLGISLLIKAFFDKTTERPVQHPR